jgi:hypothetical protein
MGTQSEPGIFLSCPHDECACRVEVHEPCRWSGQGEYWSLKDTGIPVAFVAS